MSPVVLPSPPSFSTSSEVTQVISGLAASSEIIPWHWSLICTPQSASRFVTYLWSGGQSAPAPWVVTTGGIVSTTETLNPHIAELPEVSLAVHETADKPSGKLDPGGG